MSIRKLTGLVGFLVLCTGFAVGLYVEALRGNPVEAGYNAPTQLEGPWVRHVDDVRIPSRRLRVNRDRRVTPAATSNYPSQATPKSACPSTGEITRILGTWDCKSKTRPTVALEPKPAS